MNLHALVNFKYFRLGENIKSVALLIGFGFASVAHAEIPVVDGGGYCDSGVPVFEGTETEASEKMAVWLKECYGLVPQNKQGNDTTLPLTASKEH